jgi:5'-deoxynucleotidase YfbR-like HD superfamily hydrolase
MGWMLSRTGQTIELSFIQLKTIFIEDIAHALAQINRFTGHASRPYSVAEHSLLVCEIAEREFGVRDPAALLAFLLHDAHEAYTSDLSSPMKQVIGEAWYAVEDGAQRQVLKRFGLQTAFAASRDAIRRADLMALVTERVALLPDCGPQWEAAAEHHPLDWVDLRSRAAFTWDDWRVAFLDRFLELSHGREERALELLGSAP